MRRARRPLAILALSTLALLPVALVARGARAEDAGAPGGESPLEALDAKVTAAFAAKDYEKAAALCREQIAIDAKYAGAPYNLACALARLGKKEEALASLRSSVDLGYTDAAHMQEDADLESLRGEKGFAEIVALARAADAKAVEAAYEAASPIEGVKTVEGRPEGGLRWRLRISPAASVEKPHRLVVWLHPSGGSMNAKIEPMAPAFAAKGYALLVVTAKRWSGWSDEDSRRLMEVTLPDAAKTPGLDAKRPVLMGFSAGGQAALRLWAKDPARLGGMILDAAYPMDVEAYLREHRIEPMTVPEGEAPKGVPILAFVGDADQGHMMWKMIEDGWKAMGIPLQVVYVAGGKHAWLVGQDEETVLYGWLGGLK
jgi:poly(3-hydroxybutyrate) depolymerase